MLPEGEEPRTIKAAAICAERGIGRPVLLGNPDEIRRVAEQQGVVLNDRVEIINPIDVRERYVPRLVELRKSKGMTEVVAREQLEDNVVLGTMMLSATRSMVWSPVPCTPPPTPFAHRCRSSRQPRAPR